MRISPKTTRPMREWQGIRFVVIGLSVLVALVMPLLGEDSGSQLKDSKIESKLNSIAKLAMKTGGLVPAIVQFEANSFEAEREAIIRDHGGKRKNHFAELGAASADLSPAALETLAGHPRVRHISYDHEIRANLNDTVQAVGADQVWAGSAGLRYTGKGITVAVIDSGIVPGADLSQSIIPPQVAFGSNATIDQYGHGSHVAGIITGDGQLSIVNKAYSYAYRGVAPGASVLNLCVLDANGNQGHLPGSPIFPAVENWLTKEMSLIFYHPIPSPAFLSNA